VQGVRGKKQVIKKKKRGAKTTEKNKHGKEKSIGQNRNADTNDGSKKPVKRGVLKREKEQLKQTEQCRDRGGGSVGKGRSEKKEG